MRLAILVVLFLTKNKIKAKNELTHYNIKKWKSITYKDKKRIFIC